MNSDLPSSASVQAEVLRLITHDFHQEFGEIHARTVAFTDIQPEQANNEIRNALNHMARALLETDETRAKKDVAKAYSHLDRATRDCLKIAIIGKHEHVKRLAQEVREIERVTPRKVADDLEALETRRIKALRQESRGDNGCTESMAQLLNEILAVEKYIRNNWLVDSERKTLRQKIWFWRLRCSIPIISSVAVTFFATLLVMAALSMLGIG